MKQFKRLLSLFLIAGMLIAMIPAQARAESSGTPEITDYQVLLENLNVLEEYAADYVAANPGKDPVALVLKYIRTGVDAYGSGFWNSVGGSEDSKFAAYVQSSQEAHNAAAEKKVNVTGLKNLGLIKTPNNDIVDMGRMFAVMDISYHNDGKNTYGDVAGWAGDLVDLMVLADSEGVSGTLDEMVQEITDTCFLQNAEGAAFTEAEFLGDMDGYALAEKLIAADYSEGMLGDTVEAYFGGTLTDEKRAEYFLKNRMDAVTARRDIRSAVFNGYTANELVASLENVQNFTETDLSDLRKACCYAFADYLCMLAGDYVQWNENIFYTVESSEKTTLVPGITYEKFTATSDDDKQMVYYLATADVSNPYVSVHVNYKDNDPTKGWGMQTVRDQAHAAEVRHSDPNGDCYVPNYNVIVAVNGAGYNMTTGEPAGLLMMEGVEYQAPDGSDHDGYGFFGILKDGSAIIASTEDYYDLKAQGLLMEGIDNFGYTLVKDGEIAAEYWENHTNARETRTAVGITRTGKVVFMVLDGRQEPVSCGGSMAEIAQIMLDAGCVDAINLDGGGSSTFLAEMPGDSDLSLINVPSDHFERLVSSSMIVVSTMPNPDALQSVELDAEYDYLTAGSKVQLTAKGFNAAGEPVAIPSGAVWAVSDSAVATVSADGVLSGLKNGEVEVSLKVDGKVMGKKTLQVVTPTAVYFEKDSIGVVRGATVTLPVAAQYEGKPVAIRANDISIKLSNSAGKVSGFDFTANEAAAAKNVVATVNLVANTALSDSMTIVLYNKGDVVFDFDDVTGGNQQLAWIRVVSNATSSDNLIYTAVDTSKVMTSEYTLAFDAAELPISSAVQNEVYAQLGVTKKADEAFLLQLADKVGTDSTITVKLTLYSDLNVDISKLALNSELFTLKNSDLDQNNTLTLVLGWKAQSAALNSESTNTVSILTGIAAAPKNDAGWDAQKRLALTNKIGMEYAILIKSDALYAYTQANPNKGIEAYSNTEKGGMIRGVCNTNQDSYTLVNSLKNGWFYENGGYAYYDNGQKYYGVQKVGEFYYDFGENGINAAQTKYSGLFQINGVNHYAKAGVLTGGVYDIGGTKYYFEDSGVGYDGEKEIEEVKIKFDNGLLVDGPTGFITKSDGNVYHYDHGNKSLGWVYLGDDLYHFDTETGVMTTGTHVLPDAEARAKGAYYDFDENGKTLWGYFNGYGYYYWAGAPRRNDWVKSGADKDREAWYRTNTNGHFVTTSNANEKFQLTLDGKTYTAVKIECDGVVYTFDNTNGKLLLGSMVLENGKWYYYWAGQPVNDGWLEFEGKTYYAFSDGHLATGAVTIDGNHYMFTPQGSLINGGIQVQVTLAAGNRTMNVEVVNADQNMTSARLAMWAANAGREATFQWIDLEKSGENWVAEIPMCTFGVNKTDSFELHVYGVVNGTEGMIVNTTVDHMAPAEHTYADEFDYKCDSCDEERIVDMTRPMMDMYRMYDPNGHEHFYTGSEEERDNLVAAGWNYEGVGFTFPLTTGLPVYRLYDPVTGEHLYTMEEPVKTGAQYEEKGPYEGKDLYECEGRIWLYEGIAFNSAFENEVPQYRLHNPNATRGAYHFTASEEERDTLIAAGWEDQGIGWYSMGAQ